MDRAGLDAGLALGLDIGGYCPRGRRAADGRIPDHYPLREMHSRAYPPRTRMNILRSDATLVLRRGNPTPGTRLTVFTCLAESKNFVEVDVEDDSDLAYEYVRARLKAPGVLNVAGPREEIRPGIYQQALDYVVRLLSSEGDGS